MRSRPETSDPAPAEPAGSRPDLLAEARSGSEEAGRTLMAAHGPSMLRVAWSVLGRSAPNEVDDVVQEAFMAALTTTATPVVELGAWLRAITARKALDALRSSRRRGERPLLDPLDAAGDVDLVGDPDSLVRVIAIRQALDMLSPLDRALLVLVDLERFSMQEAATILGATNVAVRLRAVRARRKLARLLHPLREGAES